MSLTQYAHEKIYALLRKELEEIKQKDSFQQAIENCFITAGNYWSELKATVDEYGFETREDEISFFKEVKPLFTSEMDYYGLLYHSILFCPMGGDLEKRFWEREGKRLLEFKEQNKEFIDYYNSGKTDLDATYYLRSDEEGTVEGRPETYDYEPGTGTSYGSLVSKLRALERYNEYARHKLIEIGKCI